METYRTNSSGSKAQDLLVNFPLYADASTEVGDIVAVNVVGLVDDAKLVNAQDKLLLTILQSTSRVARSCSTGVSTPHSRSLIPALAHWYGGTVPFTEFGSTYSNKHGEIYICV